MYSSLEGDTETEEKMMETVPIEQIVKELVEGLGRSAVIRLSATLHAEDIEEWQNGSRKPMQGEDKRLRLAHDMFVRAVEKYGSEKTVHWFKETSCVPSKYPGYSDRPTFALHDGNLGATKRAFKAFMGEDK